MINIGDRFGKLTVIKEYGYAIYGAKRRKQWLCRCDCGNEVVRENSYLKSRCRSCGCDTVHGKYKNIMNKRLYEVWQSMRRRCNDNKYPKYQNYGGRGIKICEEWNDLSYGYGNFYNWSIENGYDFNAKKLECTLDRIDVNGDYCPENCRWISNIEQQHNKRNNVYITYKNETKCIAEWSKITGISETTIRNRVAKGWDSEKIFTTPVNQNLNRYKEKHNEKY